MERSVEPAVTRLGEVHLIMLAHDPEEQYPRSVSKKPVLLYEREQKWNQIWRFSGKKDEK